MTDILNENVFKFFKQISCIPRCSGNEHGMQEFLKAFAIERNLNYYVDEYNNTIIFKKTKKCAPTILQAHVDMVCVKAPTLDFDFESDPIKVIKKGNYLCADQTTLGADNGIGVAMILDILDSDIPCNIEAVFTSSEETTMRGALNIDVGTLKSKNMICLDGFENNTIIVSSAAFVDYYVKFDNTLLPIDNTDNYNTYVLNVSGLKGGHSGYDIDKILGSSHKILAEILCNVPNILLNDFYGGHEYNVIPSNSTCIFTTDTPEKDIKNIIKEVHTNYKNIFKNLKIKYIKQNSLDTALKYGKQFLYFINNFTQGVLLKDENDNVISSQNLSEISAADGYLKIGIRNNDKSKEKEVLKALDALCSEMLMKGKINARNPLFNTKEHSRMLKKLIECGDHPKVVKTHITVECGVFQERIDGLDIAIISPTIIGAHSIKERVEIGSVISTQNWLKKYLLSK